MAQQGNPFYVKPMGDYGASIVQGIGNIAGGLAEQQKAEQLKQDQAAQQQEMQAAFASGDPNQVSGLILKYPDMREAITAAVGHRDETTKANMASTIRASLANPDKAPQIIQARIDALQATYGPDTDLDDSLQAALEAKESPETFLNNLEMLAPAYLDEQEWKAYSARKPKPVEFSQGTGAMSGYAFNKADGTFKIDPGLKQKLMVDAQEKAAKGRELVGKDLAGVNDKVTGLTKGVMGIYNAATSLSKLKDSSSPASQMAAVFKFMKALDPTSTVRESEQGMVYQAQGPGDRLAGLMNQIIGEGGMTPKGFRDVVNTAAVMANSAIGSSEREVFDYLDVISEYIDPKALAKMQARIPGRIETKDSGKMLTDEELLRKYGG